MMENSSLDNLEVGRQDKRLCLLARSLGGFADPTRLSLLLLLVRRGESRVGDLVEELDVPQPRVSDHLGYLAWCGYVEVRRTGRYAYYSVADERVLRMLSLGESLLYKSREAP